MTCDEFKAAVAEGPEGFDIAGITAFQQHYRKCETCLSCLEKICDKETTELIQELGAEGFAGWTARERFKAAVRRL